MTQRSFTSAFAAASVALLAAPIIAQSPGAGAPTFTVTKLFESPKKKAEGESAH